MPSMEQCLRLASFNLESLDDRPGAEPSLESRIPLLRSQLERLEADILCLQEVNGQPHKRHAFRRLDALDRLLEGTPYAPFDRAHTRDRRGGALELHNVVTLSRFPIVGSEQYRHERIAAPRYRATTAVPPRSRAGPLEWDRPLLRTAHDLGQGRILHLLNLHLRAPRASFVEGQKKAGRWQSVPGWAEGYLIAAIKRGGQALEARMVIDEIFDSEPDALIAVCGDLNAAERETALRILRADPDDTRNPALADRALVAAEERVRHDRRFSVLHNGRRSMLDHLLLSPALNGFLRSVEIHNEQLGDEALAAQRPPGPESFHAPVVAELTLPARS